MAISAMKDAVAGLFLLTVFTCVVLHVGATSEETPSRRIPQAIIIGVKKSGTRALLEFLRAHPDVKAPGPEMHYFDRYYDRGLDWYRDSMPATYASQLTVEKTPSYFITKQAPERIAETYVNGSEVKLIVIVRNPIDRAVSDFVQTNAKYPEMANRSFEDLALVEENGKVKVNTSWASVRIGVYYTYMQRWLQHFAMDRILVISCEQLIEQPAEVLAEAQRFLGLRNIVTPDFFTVDSQKGMPCLTKRVFTQPDGSFTVLARRKPHCLGRNKGRPHPALAATTKAVLTDFYKPWSDKFFRQIGKRFDWFL